MTEIAIKEDGSIVQRVINEHALDLLPGLEKEFAGKVKMRQTNLLDFADLGEPYFGRAAVTTENSLPNAFWWSVGIRTLNLHTTFELVKDILVPTFKNEGTADEIPWRTPEGMRVVLGIHVEGDAFGHYALGKHYLIAYDQNGATWRLPLSNLYNHLELCHGQALDHHTTPLRAVMTALKQFRSSRWNHDLVDTFQVTNAQHIFGFKPVNTGFEQQIVPNNWTDYCQKVGAPITQNFIAT